MVNFGMQMVNCVLKMMTFGVETCNGAWTRQECRWDPVPDAPGVPLGPGLGVPGWDPVPGTF